MGVHKRRLTAAVCTGSRRRPRRPGWKRCYGRRCHCALSGTFHAPSCSWACVSVSDCRRGPRPRMRAGLRHHVHSPHRKPAGCAPSQGRARCRVRAGDDGLTLRRAAPWRHADPPLRRHWPAAVPCRDALHAVQGTRQACSLMIAAPEPLAELSARRNRPRSGAGQVRQRGAQLYPRGKAEQGLLLHAGQRQVSRRRARPMLPERQQMHGGDTCVQRSSVEGWRRGRAHSGRLPGQGALRAAAGAAPGLTRGHSSSVPSPSRRTCGKATSLTPREDAARRARVCSQLTAGGAVRAAP